MSFNCILRYPSRGLIWSLAFSSINTLRSDSSASPGKASSGMISFRSAMSRIFPTMNSPLGSITARASRRRNPYCLFLGLLLDLLLDLALKFAVILALAFALTLNFQGNNHQIRNIIYASRPNQPIVLHASHRTEASGSSSSRLRGIDHHQLLPKCTRPYGLHDLLAGGGILLPHRGFNNQRHIS